MEKAGAPLARCVKILSRVILGRALVELLVSDKVERLL